MSLAFSAAVTSSIQQSPLISSCLQPSLAVTSSISAGNQHNQLVYCSHQLYPLVTLISSRVCLCPAVSCWSLAVTSHSHQQYPFVNHCLQQYVLISKSFACLQPSLLQSLVVSISLSWYIAVSAGQQQSLLVACSHQQYPLVTLGQQQYMLVSCSLFGGRQQSLPVSINHPWVSSSIW